MASAMFHYDEAMTDLVLAACRERLSMDPVALDFGGLVESLDAELAGLMRPEGNDARQSRRRGRLPDACGFEVNLHAVADRQTFSCPASQPLARYPSRLIG